jgi:hypothetical protein
LLKILIDFSVEIKISAAKNGGSAHGFLSRAKQVKRRISKASTNRLL